MTERKARTVDLTYADGFALPDPPRKLVGANGRLTGAAIAWYERVNAVAQRIRDEQVLRRARRMRRRS